MPGKMITKITRIGYVGQVVTAGLLLTVAALLMFAVIGSLEPEATPPTAKVAPGIQQQGQVGPNYQVREQADAFVQQSAQTAADTGTTVADERETTVDSPVITQLWGGKLTQDFGWQLHPLYQEWRYHNGVDISGGEGQIVPALATGEIVEIYTDKQYGLTVVVNSDNYLVAYGSLASVVVQKNTRIEAGRPIGSMGITLAEPEPHLHLAVQSQDRKEYYNPRDVFPNIPQ